MNKFSAIKVYQPMGVFYLTALPADLLLKVCFTTPLTLGENNKFWGNQRRRDSKRINEISKYLQSQDAVMPGTIILAANCFDDGTILSLSDDESSLRWFIEDNNTDENVVSICIPTSKAIAAVVDGQHRLWGFENLDEKLQQTRLPCAVFLDLPTPQQAAIFATINFNQKPVSKSQSYELFGYNLDDEDEKAWSPDKLAVFFARKLNTDVDSVFCNHIKVAAQDDRVLASAIREYQKEWVVSTATIVEGILSLISKNPKADRDTLHRYSPEIRSRKKFLQIENNPPPFRKLFLEEDRDIVIYKAIKNYFAAAHNIFWQKIETDKTCSIRKTAGIQALFRVMKYLLPVQLEKRDFTIKAWEELLSPAQIIDFAVPPFTESSGKGRTYIQDAILVAIGKKDIEDVRDEVLKAHLKEKSGGADNA